jgi:hypothetical protein
MYCSIIVWLFKTVNALVPYRLGGCTSMLEYEVFTVFGRDIQVIELDSWTALKLVKLVTREWFKAI